jgi:hypothetical protein
MLLIPVPESLHSGIEIARTILFKPKARRVWFQWDRLRSGHQFINSVILKI